MGSLEALAKKELGKGFYATIEDAERLRIVILGTGGAGNNTVHRLYHLGIEHAELIAVNTDKQDLRKLSEGVKKLVIGEKITRGLGAGGFPEIGEKAAEVSKNELADLLAGTHLLFLTAGMGGGTGTGSAPIIAEIAKEQGSIVIAIVTFPFKLERARLDKARKGIERLKAIADTVVVIDNNKLLQYVPNLPINKAFGVADEIIAKAVKGITHTIMEPSLINLDFADIKAVMGQGGVAMISVGEGEGPDRVDLAVEEALKQPLLDVDRREATGALIHVTGSENLTLAEANEIGERITEGLKDDAVVIWGARIDPTYRDKIEVIMILTGVKSPQLLAPGLEETEEAQYYTTKYYKWPEELKLI